MLKTIFDKMKPNRPGKIPSLGKTPVIRSLERNGIRVQVHRYECKNGHFEYWFVIEQELLKWNFWLRLSALPDGQMQTIIDLLQQSLDSLDRGWKQLRSVKIRDKIYFIDETLMQLRNVQDPSDIIDLKPMD